MRQSRYTQEFLYFFRILRSIVFELQKILNLTVSSCLFPKKKLRKKKKKTETIFAFSFSIEAYKHLSQF